MHRRTGSNPFHCYGFRHLAFQLPALLTLSGAVAHAGSPPVVVVDSIEPAEIVQGQVPQPEIQVFGSNFIEGFPNDTNRPTVTLRQQGKGGAEYSALAFVNFAGTVATLPADLINLLPAPLGVYDVIVTRPTDNASGTLEGAFTVTDGQPGPGEIALMVRSAWGGPVNDVEVVGNLAYAAIGRRLVILDVSDDTNPVEIGSLNIMAGVEGVAVRDGYAFLGAHKPYKFCVADVSDPTNPVLVSVSSEGPFSHDVQLYGDLAYVRDTTGQLRVVNVADPLNVVSLGGELLADVAAIVIVGDLLYVGTEPLCCEADLNIYNLASDPLNPVLLGSVNGTGERTTALAIEGDYAYLVMGHGGSLSSLKVVDISNPASPTIVDTQFGFVWARDVAVSGGYAYVADSTRFSNQKNLNDWALTKGLAIYDLADPTNLELVATFKTHGNVTGVEIVGNRAYVHDDGEGLIILDVTNPTKPVRLGNYHSPAVMRQMANEGDLLYVADAWNGFTILNVSDSAHPEVVGVYLADHYNNLGVNASGIVLRDNLVYLGAGHLGLEVVNVSNPAEPVFLGAFRIKNPSCTWYGAVNLSGDVAHIGWYLTACSTADLWDFVNLDISDPGSIFELGELGSFVGRPRRILTTDKEIAFIGRSTGSTVETDLTIDTSDPGQPEVIYEGVIPGVADVALVGGNILYLASDHIGAVDPEPGLYIQEVTDPATPTLLGLIHGDLGDEVYLDLAYSIVVQNERAYLIGRGCSPPGDACGIQVAYVLDVSSPIAPVLLDTVPYVGGTKSSLFVNEPFVYATNEFEGPNDPAIGLVVMEVVGLNPVGDLDGDGSVGVKDLLILLGDWGPCDDCTDCPADLDGDCTVGVKDLLILLGNWG